MGCVYKAKRETLKKNINKTISNLKLKQFISFDISYKEGEVVLRNKKDNTETTKIKELATVKINIDEKAKNEATKLDGCYAITTSLLNSTKDTKEEMHEAYKKLINVENAFKTLKTDFLEIRPLYLKTDKRIKGHVALSMLAYNIVLNLKRYIQQAELDFKSTIRKLSLLQTNINKLNIGIYFETISEVNNNLKTLFKKMNLKLPTRL